MAIHYPADYEIFSLVCIDDVRCKPKDPTLIEYGNKKLSKFTDKYGEFIATAEDDLTIRAMMDLEQKIGKNIIWVRGESFENVISQKGLLPNKLKRFCTTEMKMKPIFYYCNYYIGEKVQMRIGFRYDEYDRMEKFLNNSNPTNFKVADTCNLFGEKRQNFIEINWRYCHFILVKNGINEPEVIDFFDKYGYVGGNLFEELRKMEFPIDSNCKHCFIKKIETLNAISVRDPNIMQWASEQENKTKGTWIKNVRYDDIIQMNKNVIPLMIEQELDDCSIGGCQG
jgi:hypothetical protein